MGTEFHLGRQEVLQMEGGGGRTTVRMCLMPVNCTLKNGREVILHYVYFITIKMA